MSNLMGDPSQWSNSDVALDVLKELESQKQENIRKRRAHDRVNIRCKVELLAGNASDGVRSKAHGVTGDISSGGCRAMFTMPVAVGDVFRLQFDTKEFDLPLLYARCLRCRLVRDDAFEVGFEFFSKIALPQASQEGEDDLLA